MALSRDIQSTQCQRPVYLHNLAELNTKYNPLLILHPHSSHL